jgi:hypothetical protein
MSNATVVGLVGLRVDPMIVAVGTELNRLSCRFFLLDVSGHGYLLSSSGKGGLVRCPDGVFNLEEVNGLYVRQLSVGRPAGEKPTRDDSDAEASLRCWLDYVPTLVMNRPMVASSNESKPYQEVLIRGCGFLVPETIVTNNPDEAASYFHSCRGDVIYKSISNIGSVVTKMTSADLSRLSLLCSCPVQFQRWIRGTDIRVHTVGNEVFACEIVSDEVDYRYSPNVSVQPTRLSDEEESRCVLLARSLGFELAGIDLRRTDEGLYCFEVNPVPAFWYYEQKTGQEISRALALRLSRPVDPHSDSRRGKP